MPTEIVAIEPFHVGSHKQHVNIFWNYDQVKIFLYLISFNWFFVSFFQKQTMASAARLVNSLSNFEQNTFINSSLFRASTTTKVDNLADKFNMMESPEKSAKNQEFLLRRKPKPNSLTLKPDSCRQDIIALHEPEPRASRQFTLAILSYKTSSQKLAVIFKKNVQKIKSSFCEENQSHTVWR